MILQGTQDDLFRKLTGEHRDVPPMPQVKCKVLPYQMAALYILAQRYNREGARLLEIGTGHGGSGFMLAKAAPRAKVVSLTNVPEEAARAAAFWAKQGLANIKVQVEASWDFLERQPMGSAWDFVFVDGDHNRIKRDLPWFDMLAPGGLLICHDYSPQDSRCPSGVVFAELNNMLARLGRPFDVLLTDEGKVGMAGFYRQNGEECLGAPPPPRIGETAEQPAGRAIVLRADPGPTPRCPQDVKVVLRAEDPDNWDLPADRVLFVRPGAVVPWDLLAAGFSFLGRWDVAAPLCGQLARDIGTETDQERTRAVVRDLRIPAYCPDLLFVRSGPAGEALLDRWRIECDGGDERLAFLRALHRTKPLFLALPRVWLAPQAERAAITAPPLPAPGKAQERGPRAPLSAQALRQPSPPKKPATPPPPPRDTAARVRRSRRKGRV